MRFHSHPYRSISCFPGESIYERLALAGDATCNNEVNPAQAERPRSEARRKHDWRVADESLRIGVHQEIGGNGKNSEDNDNAKATRP